MLSKEIADLGTVVMGEERIPAELRCALGLVLADLAAKAVPLENAPVPVGFRGTPPGCISLEAERARRAAPHAGWVL